MKINLKELPKILSGSGFKNSEGNLFSTTQGKGIGKIIASIHAKNRCNPNITSIIENTVVNNNGNRPL